MSELDQALEKYIQDDNEQAGYYYRVLHTDFYLPTRDQEAAAGRTAIAENDTIAPIIVDAEGKSYLMLFDSEERLGAWAKEPVSYAVLPGHAIARMTPSNLHWAVNVGTDCAKEFVPEEIGWLRDIVLKSEMEGETGA